MWVVIFVCVFTKLADSTERILEAEEPQCYSRFDYEYKVLQHLVSLKEAEKELRDVTDELQSKVKDLEEKVKGKGLGCAIIHKSFNASLVNDSLLALIVRSP